MELLERSLNSTISIDGNGVRYKICKIALMMLVDDRNVFFKLVLPRSKKIVVSQTGPVKGGFGQSTLPLFSRNDRKWQSRGVKR